MHHNDNDEGGFNYNVMKIAHVYPQYSLLQKIINVLMQQIELVTPILLVLGFYE